MSHFSATLKQILHQQPRLSHEAWADKFGVYPAHLTMMTEGGGALSHRVIAKIACHLPTKDREKLIAAYFQDECASIEKEAAAAISDRLGWGLKPQLTVITKPAKAKSS